MRMMKSLVLLLAILLSLTSSQRQSPTPSEIVTSITTKLLKLCQQSQQIDFFECEPKMIANDKKTGNFRHGHNYTKQTIYMMAVYDTDGNGKISRKELEVLGMDVMNQKISDAKIQRKIREIEGEGYRKRLETQSKNEEIQQITTQSFTQQL